MEHVDEMISPIPSLGMLQTQIATQIANLLSQKEKLGDVSTHVTELISRYNAQKSYLGRAAYWYGEQVWWLQITITIVAAGIGILMYIPTLISFALSLVASFLLLHHHQSSQQRDQLIAHDLHAQNQSVQTMIQDLETAKTNLEEKLVILCKINQDMCSENIKLHQNVTEIREQVITYKTLSEKQIGIIDELQVKERLLNTQLEELQQHLGEYKQIVENGATEFLRTNSDFLRLTTQLTEDSEKLRAVTADIVSSTQVLSKSPSSSPDSLRTQQAINAANTSGNAFDPESLLGTLADKKKALTPQRPGFETPK